MCIIYLGSKLDLHVYTAFDLGSYKDTRRSTIGVLIMMARDPVHWISKLQPIVTVLYKEAEYLACFSAIQDIQDIMCISQLLMDVDLERSRSTKVLIDNHHKRSKHIDIKCNWICNIVVSKAIESICVPTTKQLADFLSKTFPSDVI